MRDLLTEIQTNRELILELKEQLKAATEAWQQDRVGDDEDCSDDDEGLNARYKEINVSTQSLVGGSGRILNVRRRTSFAERTRTFARTRTPPWRTT